MKRALIHINRVCQVVEVGQEFTVHADLSWVDCPDEVTPETHEWNGGIFAEITVDTPEPPIPSTVSMYQARTALSRAGHLATVNAALATMPGPAGEEARIKWEFAPTVKRTDALTAAMAGVLGLTEQQLDDLFTTAAAII
jgi:hypothetical protein